MSTAWVCVNCAEPNSGALAQCPVCGTGRTASAASPNPAANSPLSAAGGGSGSGAFFVSGPGMAGAGALAAAAAAQSYDVTTGGTSVRLAEGEWSCQRCTMINSRSSAACSLCEGTVRASVSSAASSEVPTLVLDNGQGAIKEIKIINQYCRPSHPLPSLRSPFSVRLFGCTDC